MQIQIHFRTTIREEEEEDLCIYILKANVLFRRHENDVGRVRRAYDRVDFQHDVHHILFSFFLSCCVLNILRNEEEVSER